jgi:hypothetical protein
VKAPKTAQGQRIIPIHAHLVPMLDALGGDDDALVLGTFNASEDHMAPSFRDHLATAHVERPRLTADNATEKPIDFRSLRDTFAQETQKPRLSPGFLGCAGANRTVSTSGDEPPIPLVIFVPPPLDRRKHPSTWKRRVA